MGLRRNVTGSEDSVKESSAGNRPDFMRLRRPWTLAAVLTLAVIPTIYPLWRERELR